MEQLGIFAKYWQAGAVKTRLAATIGGEPAAEIYRAFVVRLLERLGAIGDRRVLAVTPAERAEPFHRLAGDAWTVTTQCDGDLGRRMRHYFQSAVDEGARRVVLLGSDSPTVPLDYVQRAFALLKEFPVVLGPSGDGGYYLVGASGQVPPIFEGIDWGTGVVWEQTVKRLAAAACEFAELPPWYDVDQVQDLSRLQTELTELSSTDATWKPLLEQVELALRESKP